MYDVKAKIGKRTFFSRPYFRSNLERPDIPLKKIHLSYDSDFGPSVETRWYLSRLLGLEQPEGTEALLLADVYGEKGAGVGVEIEYERENYFGNLQTYLMSDTGEDDLGRLSGRKNLEPKDKLRGRAKFQHRHFLPFNWQLTLETSYLSDEHFLESYYRGEFNNDKEQETIFYLKQLRDNWALAFLGKWRINNFQEQIEELPSLEFHWTGQSFFDDKFTLYSDSKAGRFRQRIGDDHPIPMSKKDFTFISTRTEIDMPIQVNTTKIVPFVAGSFGYDDRSGFSRSLVDGSGTGSFGEDKVWIGEIGVRLAKRYWKVHPAVKSRLWDLNQIRHIIRPEVVAVLYGQSDSSVKQKDTINLGLSQIWQTKRGSEGKERTIDWIRLNLDATWVKDSEDHTAGPDKFVWNKPFVPLSVFSAPAIFNGDFASLGSGLTRFEKFGPRRNMLNGDFIWRLSDTTAVLSDLNADIQSGVVQQFNIGFTRLRWPNLSYYIGSRYLRRVNVLDEKGSNAFTFSATYAINPRYTVTFAQQFDFDYGVNMRSDVTLIRRYHRIYYGFTFSADRSLDRQAIVFSIWPEGVKELAIGSRRYMGLTGSAGY